MRRKDREIPKNLALAVSDKCEWAVLSMIDIMNNPYCLPISIVRQNETIYFHSAKEGAKIEALKKNNQICLTCVGETYRMPDKFTTEFESAIIRGKAFEVFDTQEKILALSLLCQRHTPTNMDNFEEAINRSIERTAVWKIEISEITGKCKKYDKHGKQIRFERAK